MSTDNPTLASDEAFVAVLTRHLAPLPEGNHLRRFFDTIIRLEGRDRKDAQILGKVAAEFFDRHSKPLPEVMPSRSSSAFFKNWSLSEREALREVSHELDPQLMGRRAFLKRSTKGFTVAAAFLGLGMVEHSIANNERKRANAVVAGMPQPQQQEEHLVFNDDGQAVNLMPSAPLSAKEQADIEQFLKHMDQAKKFENLGNQGLAIGGLITAILGLQYAVRDYRLHNDEKEHDASGKVEQLASTMLQRTQQLLTSAKAVREKETAPAK